MEVVASVERDPHIPPIKVSTNIIPSAIKQFSFSISHSLMTLSRVLILPNQRKLHTWRGVVNGMGF